MEQPPWRVAAAHQAGLLAISQLPDLGVTRATLRNQLRAERWAMRTDRVLSTTTGELNELQRMWLGVLHVGNGALVGGLTAARRHGLRGWDRDKVTILVPDDWSFEPVPGLHFFRTRRPLALLRTSSPDPLPVCRIEPAVLIFGGYDRSARTAQGVVAAVVQQRLASPEAMRRWVLQLRPLRRARMFERALLEIESGAQSLAELDVRRMCRRAGLRPPTRQRPRQDRDGRLRFTDAEWDLPDGRVVVLEVDGGFHMDVSAYDDDMRRQRKLTTPGRMILRCGAAELRDHPDSVALDLIAVGVERLSA